jgi:hypothetical protein
MKKLLQNFNSIIISILLLASCTQASVKTPINSSPSNHESGITSPYTFTWSLSEHGSAPDAYEVQISTNQDFTNIVADIKDVVTTNINIDLTSLNGGTTYFWRVIATKKDKHPKTSDYTCFTTNLNLSLPVELISFSSSVSGNEAILKWTTATEVNNYGFEIERKSENSGWQKIGFVSGSGNSNSPHSYSFTDQPNSGTSFSYRIKQLDNNGQFEYYDAITISLASTNGTKLLQNSPNPFNPSTSIKFYVPQSVDVTIKIYNILGAEVTTLVNKAVSSCYHVAYWNGKDNYGNSVSSGVYLYRLTAGNFTETKKMNLLK